MANNRWSIHTHTHNNNNKTKQQQKHAWKFDKIWFAPQNRKKNLFFFIYLKNFRNESNKCEEREGRKSDEWDGCGSGSWEFGGKGKNKKKHTHTFIHSHIQWQNKDSTVILFNCNFTRNYFEKAFSNKNSKL